MVEFNSRPRLVEDFTTDIDRLKERVFSTESMGFTALYDSVYLALDKMKNAHRSKKALLLISDGQDNTSRYGFLDTLEYHPVISGVCCKFFPARAWFSVLLNERQ